MSGKKYLLIRLFYILFTVSVSLTVLPCGIVNAHGLFGEVTVSAFAKEAAENMIRPAQEARRLRETAKKQQYIMQSAKILIFNLWLVILAQILYQRFREYPVRLPRGDTIVTLKVRMDD